MKKLFLILILGISQNLYSQWSQSSNYYWGSEPSISSWQGSVSIMNGYSLDNVISVFNSEDQSWSTHFLNNFEPPFTDFHHEDSRLIIYNHFMSTSTMVAVSPDFGTNWNYYDLGCLTDVCIVNGSIIAADMYGYINISNDEGVTWTWLPVPDFLLNPEDPMLLAADGNILFIACPNYLGYDLYKCNIENGTFNDLQFVRTLGNYNSVNDIITHNGDIYIATYDGLMFSEDHGESVTMISNDEWYQIVADSAFFYVRNTGIRKYSFEDHSYTQILPAGSSIWQIGACNGGVFALLSYNGGFDFGLCQYANNTWEPVQALYVSEATSFRNVRVLDNLIFSNNQQYSNGTLTSSKICISHDFGKTYNNFSGSSLTTFMDALKSGDRYLISGGGGVAVADTINHTLVQTAGIVGDTALTLLSHNGKLYCGTTDGLYSSADNGMHWTFAGLSGKRINKIAAFDGKLFAATPSGLFMSQDGTAWGTTSCPLTLCTDIEGIGDRLFVSSYAGLVMYYQSSWIPVGAGLLGTGINALVSRNNVLYAGTSFGSVMYSQDNGETWTDISNPSFNAVTGLDIWGGHIYASEAQSGIWSRFIGFPQQVDELSNQGVTVYPVPARERLTVQMPEDKTGPAILEVLNMQGLLLMEIQDDRNTVQVDLRNLADGMYILKVRYSGRTFTARFIHR